MFNGALPAGGIEAGHWPLIASRAAWLCGLFSASGALAFRALEPAGAAWVRRKLQRLIVGSLALAVAAWIVWVVLQAAVIAGAGDLAGALAALRPVFARTAFGHQAAVQIGLVLLAWATLRAGWLPALLALGAVAMQVGHLHAWAMSGTVNTLTVAVLLHLGAASLWLGGLLPLRLVVGAAPLPAAIAAVRRFSARAIVLVILLALTALLQGVDLFGGVAGLFGATYGWVAMAKTALFAILLGFAWRNRFRLTPALSGPDPVVARAMLGRSIARETAVGALVLGVAAILTALPPGMHVEPTWPFTFRLRSPFSFTAPFQPATPTSFYRSDTGFTAASITTGATLFAKDCAGCHAGTIALSGADGDLFWLITSGAGPMPGFAATLDEEARWQVIDFLHARAEAGTLPAPAPDIQLACADGSTPMLSELRGRPVRIRFAAAGEGCRADDADAAAAYALVTGMTLADLAGADLDVDAAGRLRAVSRLKK